MKCKDQLDRERCLVRFNVIITGLVSAFSPNSARGDEEKSSFM